MTQKLANDLIEYYSKHIAAVEGMEDLEEIDRLLDKAHIDLGLCEVLEKVLKLHTVEAYRDDWVLSELKKTSRRLFLFQTPFDAPTKALKLQALRLRLELLKTYKDE